MNKRCRLLSLFGVFALALVLTACQGSTPPPATATATEPPQPTTTDTQVTTEPAVDCKPYTSLFTKVTEKDRVIGPENAPVTMIEYGDYQ